ncbi:hypothetical protein JX265_008209 [Neoarthrinium moseri]|uniref:Glycoside hydrolase family 93 protein n=1 Tax=Neoarthrinium moseri TaxID=1658444 RepID=A0A9Q0AMF2_9PEZI|nr:uncharacterized protein JN550_004907 [Neoarthrinium moseri]KAI1851985.1 hypothetical protein JX266_002838 [Neoarthrinium moseri]KAI1865162.1 hypothetical protein JX265_008209 [Neoarthrinium moseri]KAI1870761.1 hypothetical protein JN550_004907 [Neoarthrinium moseri]
MRSVYSFALAALTGLSAALSTFEHNLLFQPPENYTDPRTLYARTVQLSDGSLLATWENYSPEPPPVWFPIYQSLDDGVTWAEISRVEDQVYGFGLRYQPFLYELPQAFGDYEAGTILASGSAIPTDLNQTNIEVYASRDKGVTWEFVSHIAHGGVALPNNGETPVWEPFILTYDNTLIVYYSDQRDERYGQKLVHQTTTDLVNWSDVVDDVAYPTYTDRPGMPILTLLPNGSYFYVFEYGGGPAIADYTFPIYYRIVDDPREIAGAADHYISVGGNIPVSSPYVVWSSVGGDDGSIIVSSGRQPLYINRALGDPNAWEEYQISQPAAYTRHLRVFEQDDDYLLVMGAGVLPPSTTNNVTASVYRVSEILGL